MPVAYDDDDAGGGPVLDTGYDSDADIEAVLLGDDNQVKPGSLLASVARKAATFVAKPTRIEIPAVPGLFAEYATTLETRQLARLRAAADRHPDKNARQFRFNLLLLAHYNTGLYLNGEPLTDGDGALSTFRSRELWEQFDNVKDSAAAVYEMFGKSDFAVIQAASGLMTDAGIDTELTRQDPS
jgi:hypothetical protein